MLDKVMKFKNESESKYLALTISKSLDKGSATKNILKSVLNDIRQTTGIKTLKHYTKEVLNTYVKSLQERLENNELSKKTTANYAMALNQIARYLEDRTLQVSAKEFELSVGHIDYTNKSASLETHNKFVEFLNSKAIQDERYKALAIAVELTRAFGLRIREAIGLTKDTINKALATNTLHLTQHDGTKNSKPRDVPVEKDAQKAILKTAQEYMKQNHTQHLFSEKEFTRTQSYRFAQKAVQDFKQQTGIDYHYHKERHAYAHNRLKETDESTVAKELGHNRLEKTYVAK